MTQCGFLEILESVENTKVDNSDGLLGHKTAVFYVGNKPGAVKIKKEKIVSIKKLRQNAKSGNGTFKFREDEDVEDMARDFNEICVDLAEQSTVECKIKPKSKHAIFMNELDKAGHEVIRKDKVKKNFYNFINAIKKGFSLDEDGEDEKPKLEDLSKKLEDKYANLYRPNREIADSTINQIFKLEDNDLQGRWIESRKNFKKLIMSTSNSGAKDCFKLSLKMSKTIFGSSSQIRDRFHLIAKRCLQEGVFPKIWKEDTISFLYKRKGERLDPGLSVLDDKNVDNHAYKSGRSCLSAITAVQKCFYENAVIEDRNLGCGKIRDYRLVTIISAGDIASAFESIDHITIEKIFERCFRNDSRFKIGKILRSYLHRKSFAVDRQSNESYELKKVYEDQTAPQGSLLSPKLWRLFDCIFSKLYVDCLANLVKRTEYIWKIDHISYADDHLTILLLKIYDDESDHYTAEKIKNTLKLTRELLFKTTTMIGCSINPTKSENIMEDSLHRGIQEIETEKEDKKKFKDKSKFKWLGYYLCLNPNHNLDFCETSANAKLREILEEEKLAYQYTDSIHFKWQMYKTYVCPYIELFLPLHIQHGFDKISKIKKIQHKCLAAVTNLHGTVSRAKLEEVMREKSIEHKTYRMARRLTREYRNLYLEIRAEKQEKIQDITEKHARAGNRNGKIRNGDLTNEAYMVADNLRNHYFYKLLMANFECPMTFEDDHRKINFKKVKGFATEEKKKLRDRIAQQEAVKKRKAREDDTGNANANTNKRFRI